MENKDKKMDKKPRFKTLSKENKDQIMRERKAENTNKATKMWMDCFREYLAEKNLPPVDQLKVEDLPPILKDFYTEVKPKNTPKKTKTSKGNPEDEKENDNNEEELDPDYKNSSLRCMRAALNRYFKEHLGVDIINNELFVNANEMFHGVTKKGRREG